MKTITKAQHFFGREFTPDELSLVHEVVATCSGISRKELAYTVCELLDWKRANGKLKERECRDLLEHLESRGFLRLPDKMATGSCKPGKQKATGVGEWPYSMLAGSVGKYGPLSVEMVEKPDQRRLFKDLVGRYHYLGYAMPFGARLQYLVYTTSPRDLVACLQFSSPAWRLKVRDQWIGWDDAVRARRLQRVVNNSRFLVLAQIKNLASKALAATLSQLGPDWKRHYGIEPWLIETMVDRSRYSGACYRGANWVMLGETAGRGRMDRRRERLGADVKTVLVYPLIKNAACRLAAGGDRA